MQGLLLNNSINLSTSVFLINGKIGDADYTRIRSAEEFDLSKCVLFPGFIDVHNHGAIGIDVNEATTGDLIEVSRFLASNGITGWLPTFVPDSDENYKRQIARVEKAMEIQEKEPVARILGVHYEGVFANREMCGALRPEFFKSFKTGNEVSELPRLSSGAHMTTLAPEVENGVELVRALSKQGWIVSIGHTKAGIKTLDAARDAGAKHMTHFFNAMTGLHHRDVGVAGWGLTNDDVTFDIIADGIHVSKQMVKFACECKGPDKVSLISDSVMPTGKGDGDFEIWGEKVSVVNGKTQNERGSIAGSVITMLDAVKNTLELGFSHEDVSKMASLNPAKLLGIENECGSTEAGKRADLVAIDGEGKVKLCLVGGKIAYNGL